MSSWWFFKRVLANECGWTKEWLLVVVAGVFGGSFGVSQGAT